jgi:phosphate transport system ATP-binding protein
MPHISLRNLTIGYGNQQALRDITVDIPDGQITAVIGPSGCGKTTLLKSMNRLIDLSEQAKVEGQVIIDGINIYDQSMDVLALRKKVGFLSQRPYPLPMSIYDNVAFGPRIHRMNERQLLQQIGDLEKHLLLKGSLVDPLRQSGKAKGKGPMGLFVEYYLRLAGLWNEVKDRLYTPAAQLSIGQQQRLALARALTIEPEVILADEPTSALDPLSAELVERQFKLLKKVYSIVVVTHILRQARRIADYIVFLYMGELVEHGPAETFFTMPVQSKTRAYISGEIS